MKKTLLFLTLTLTTAISSLNASETLTSAESLNILTKGQTLLREIPTPRTNRANREVRENRTVKIEKNSEVSALPIARTSRKIRENRLIAQTTRENRKVRHVLILNKLHIASVK